MPEPPAIEKSYRNDAAACAAHQNAEAAEVPRAIKRYRCLKLCDEKYSSAIRFLLKLLNGRHRKHCYRVDLAPEPDTLCGKHFIIAILRIIGIWATLRCINFDASMGLAFSKLPTTANVLVRLSVIA